jgi:hypothetical protein
MNIRSICGASVARASVAQSSEQAPFTSEIVSSILATDSCEKKLSAESRGFSPGAPVSSHRES